MRLWHKDLIKVLPKKQLMGQWLECNILINNLSANKPIKELFIIRILNYSVEDLLEYVKLVYDEMQERGYNPNKLTLKKCSSLPKCCLNKHYKFDKNNIFKNWHNGRYLKQCYYNLQEKYDCGGIKEEEWKIIDEYTKFN